MDADSFLVFLLDPLFGKAKTEQDGIRGHREGVWRVVEGGLGSLGWVEGGLWSLGWVQGGVGQQPMPSTFTTQSGTDGRQADCDEDHRDGATKLIGGSRKYLNPVLKIMSALNG